MRGDASFIPGIPDIPGIAIVISICRAGRDDAHQNKKASSVSGEALCHAVRRSMPKRKRLR
ncbi:hypothetical protein [Burkholderia stagnalis]|uniref:hypothetical protein n=1 Tax=Burkholderia stagnalis TaxID=1503054 RepID=UPI0012DA26E6|nr:hypothetical protein [Burkholderia stagnalis]